MRTLQGVVAASAHGDDPVGFQRELVDLLKLLRAKCGGPTFRDIAQRLPGSPSHVNDVFNGKKIPSGDLAAGLARVLGGDIEAQRRARTYAEAAAIDRVRVTVATTARDPTIRSAYLEQVRRIAPPVLYGRESELAELNEFCAGPDTRPYAHWVAPAWAGKSALLAWFTLNPPRCTQVVSFFVTSRYSGHSDRQAFVRFVLEQLTALTGQPLPQYMDSGDRELRMLAMLRETAERCRRRGERLVLLVDGLDEDCSTINDPEGHSIAALLPVHPPPGLRVILSGRPSPPVPYDVSDDHPLRDRGIIRLLSPSMYARAVRMDALRDLKRLLRGTQTEQDVLGWVVAAGGGLSSNDLSELTAAPRWQVEEILHTVNGRSFARQVSDWRPAQVPEVFLLAHEELQAQAVEFLGEERLAYYQSKLCAWVDGYRGQGWPTRTPEWALRGYFLMLRAAGETGLMMACATDIRRHTRMLDITGGDMAASTEISITIDTVTTESDVDLTAAARLAIHRHHLVRRNSNLPIELPRLWARLGSTIRAQNLAMSMSRPENRAWALTGVVLALVNAGQHDRAMAITDQLESVATAQSRRDEDQWGSVVTATVKALILVNRLDRAEVLAESLTGLNWSRWARKMLLKELVGTGHAERAEAVANRRPEPYRRLSDLADVASALVKTGDADAAVALMRKGAVDDGWGLDQVIRALINCGNLDQAMLLAERIEGLASERDTHGPDIALAAAARVYGAAGQPTRVESLLPRISPESHEMDSALEALAHAWAVSGELKRAADTAASIRNPEAQWVVNAKITAALVKRGDFSHADAHIRTIAEGKDRAQACRSAASEFLAKGELERGLRIADEAVALFRSAKWRGYEGDSLDVMLEILATELVAATPPDTVCPVAAKAASIAWTIKLYGPRYKALTSIAHALIDANANYEAVKLAEQIEAHARSTNAFATPEELIDLVQALAATGNAERALSFVNPIPESHRPLALAACASELSASDPDRSSLIARSIDFSRRNDALTDVINAWTLTGRPAAALELAQSLSDDYYKVRAIDSVLSAIDKLGLDRAQIGKLIAKSEPAVRSIGDRYPLAMAQASLAIAQVRVTDIKGAMAVAFSINVPNRPDLRDEQIARIATALASAGRLAETGTLLDTITSLDSVISTYSFKADQLRALVAALVRAGAHHRASVLLRCAEAATRSKSNEYVFEMKLGRIAAAMVLAGEPDKGEALVTEIQDPENRVAALTEIVSACVESGDHGRAVAVARRAEQVARQIDRNKQGLPKIVDAFIQVGDLDSAETLARSIPDAYRQPEAATAVAQAWARAGGLERAQAVICSIDDPDRRSAALASIALTAEPFHARRLVGLAMREGTSWAPMEALARVAPAAVVAVADELSLFMAAG